MNIVSHSLLFLCFICQFSAFDLINLDSDPLLSEVGDALSDISFLPEALDQAGNLLETISSIAEELGEEFPKPVAAVFKVLGQIGKMFGMFSGSSKPSATEMKVDALIEQVDEMIKIMGKRFNRIDALFVGNSFVADIVIKVEMMEELMINFLMVPSRSVKKQFLFETAQNDPVSLIMEIKYRIRYHETNPLIHAMKADKYRTKATFNYWKQWIFGIMARLTFIQTFYNGVNCPAGMNPDESNSRLFETAESSVESVEDFLKNYEAPYWPTTVEEVVHEAQDNSTDPNTIAQYITNKLNDTLIRDALYIIAYEHMTTIDNHMTTNNMTQEYRSWNRQGTNVVVYRSTNGREHKNNKEDDMRTINQTLDEYKNKLYSIADKDNGEPGFTKTFEEITERLKGIADFLAIIRTEAVAIQSIGRENIPGQGPGAFTTSASCDRNSVISKCTVVIGY